MLILSVLSMVYLGDIVVKDVDIPPKESRKKVGSKNVAFYIQPYLGVKTYVNGVKRRVYVKQKDKSIGVMSLKIAVYEDGLGSKITFEKRGFENKIVHVTHVKKPKKKRRAPLIALDKKGSLLSYQTRLKTGYHPKSCRFIDNNQIVVPLLEDKRADLFDIKTGERKKVAPPWKYAKKKGFVESLLVPNRNELWLSQLYNNTIQIFDATSFKYLATVRVKGKWGKVLTLGPEGKFAYLSNWSSRNISVIDVETRKEVRLIDTMGVPRGMTFSEDGKYLYVAQYGIKKDWDRKGQILKISLIDDKIVKRIGRKGAKRHLIRSKLNGQMYLSDMSKASIYVYDKDDNEIKSIRVFSHPNTIAMSKDEKTLFVSCRGHNNPESFLKKGPDFGRVYIIDLEKLEVVEYLETGNQATGLDVSPDGKYLCATDFLDNGVRIYKINNKFQ